MALALLLGGASQAALAEDGSKGSPVCQRFDLTGQGPLLGITYTF